jgi:hypothetical protein
LGDAGGDGRDPEPTGVETDEGDAEALALLAESATHGDADAVEEHGRRGRGDRVAGPGAFRSDYLKRA